MPRTDDFVIQSLPVPVQNSNTPMPSVRRGMHEVLQVHVPIIRRCYPYLGLKPPLKHLFSGELEHEVEFLLVLAKESKSGHAAKQSGSLKQTFGVFRVQSEELTGSLFAKTPTIGR